VDQANWGEWFFAASKNEGLSTKTGFYSEDVRREFITQGKLDNAIDSNYRAIQNAW
jgi:hypothetical protein